jgi:hypothetical protein
VAIARDSVEFFIVIMFLTVKVSCWLYVTCFLRYGSERKNGKGYRPEPLRGQFVPRPSPSSSESRLLTERFKDEGRVGIVALDMGDSVRSHYSSENGHGNDYFAGTDDDS